MSNPSSSCLQIAAENSARSIVTAYELPPSAVAAIAQFIFANFEHAVSTAPITVPRTDPKTGAVNGNVEFSDATRATGEQTGATLSDLAATLGEILTELRGQRKDTVTLADEFRATIFEQMSETRDAIRKR